jgi:hypothetical protein
VVAERPARRFRSWHNRFAMKLIIQTVTTRDERTVATTFEDGLMAQTQGMRWFPDGNSLLVRDRVSGRVVFKRIDVHTVPHALSSIPRTEERWPFSTYLPTDVFCSTWSAATIAPERGCIGS